MNENCIDERAATLHRAIDGRSGVFVLSAPSGWGKSQLLMRYEAKYEGVCYFGGAVRLLPGSVRHNIELGRSPELPDYEGLLRDFTIHLDVPHADLASVLSTGQQQRVRLLRALTSPAQVLLLDELLSGLDQDNFVICYQYLSSLALRSNLSVVMVHHGIENYGLKLVYL